MEAQKFLTETSEELLTKMGIPSQIQVSEEEGRLLIDLKPENPDDSSFLIGFHGQTLNALQAVLGVMLMRKVGEFQPFSLESGGYRQQREEELRRRALEAADKARFLLKEVAFPAMPAVERRVVHVTLQDEKGVFTESRGEDRERHVVVVPGEKSAGSKDKTRSEITSPASQGKGSEDSKDS